jgi:hypothetical protein
MADELPIEIQEMDLIQAGQNPEQQGEKAAEDLTEKEMIQKIQEKLKNKKLKMVRPMIFDQEPAFINLE